ncbi:MAG: ribosomal protein S18-alanine N-acetyltransferase [Desulfurococcales archaeon]|nr:ribosomal protein S18-alanine N-acetyltransferase [Desulfurococcales archaeon]
MESVIVREVRISELETVKSINEKVLPENYPLSFYYSIAMEWGDIFLVAEVDGRIVGYMMNRIENHFSVKSFRPGIVRKGHILSIAVLPEFQGKGIGSRLLAEGLKRMRKLHHVDNVYLEVRVSNIMAINFYKKFGFEIKTVIPHYYRDGEDAYLMEIVFTQD